MTLALAGPGAVIVHSNLALACDWPWPAQATGLTDSGPFLAGRPGLAWSCLQPDLVLARPFSGLPNRS